MHRFVTRALLAAIAFTPTTRAAELLTNGGFESQPNFGSGAVGNDGSYSAFTDSQIPGWTIAPGHAVTVHNHGYAYISGTYSVNLDGEGFNSHNADFYQDFIAPAAGTLTLSFDHAGWNPSIDPAGNRNFNDPSVFGQVVLLDLTTDNPIYSQSFPWTAAIINETFSFPANGHTLRLVIFENPESHYNDNTLIVDNFSVTSIAERVPGDTAPYDNVIDLNDLNNVLNNFGSANPVGYAWPRTQPSAGGPVDLNDLNLVLNNFGNHAAATALSIPEPTSALTCLIATSPLLTARRHRRQQTTGN